MPKVYFLADRRRPRFVKIGVAIDPVKRLAGLQTGNPDELEIKACMSGGYRLERALHRAFADEFHKGEWYVLTHRLAAFINDLQQIPVDPISEEDACELENELGADLRELGLPIERRVEKFVARHDKNDGEGVSVRQVKDRFDLTDEDIRKFICRLRLYMGRTNWSKPIKDKTYSFKYVIFFDGGQADIEHGDERCKCPWCINKRMMPEPRLQ